MSQKPSQRVNADEQRAAITGVFLKRLEVLFTLTHNPVHAWHAYRTARHYRVAIPNWVLEYFDRCSRALTAPEGTSSPKSVITALELRRGRRGGPQSSRRARTEDVQLGVVQRVLIEMNRRGLERPTLDVFGAVSEQVQRSESTVKNTYYRWTGDRPAPPKRRSLRASR